MIKNRSPKSRASVPLSPRSFGELFLFRSNIVAEWILRQCELQLLKSLILRLEIGVVCTVLNFDQGLVQDES